MQKHELIEYLKNTMPYPVDVFPEPSDRELDELYKTLRAKNISSERVFAWFGRRVYNATIERIEENLDD